MPAGFCPKCESPEVSVDKSTYERTCLTCGHKWQGTETPMPQPPVPQIQPYPDSITDVLVYYTLENRRGWSSPDLESARAEVERFHKTGRIRPRIIKITETWEVVK